MGTSTHSDHPQSTAVTTKSLVVNRSSLGSDDYQRHRLHNTDTAHHEKMRPGSRRAFRPHLSVQHRMAMRRRIGARLLASQAQQSFNAEVTAL